MKNKKIKKLSKLVEKIIKDEFTKHSDRVYENSKPMGKALEFTDWSEYNEEVSEKFKKMILDLCNYKNNIYINVSLDRISISTPDITKIKSPTSKNTNNSIWKDDDYAEMCIIKDTGFNINYGYNTRSKYKDEKIFDELYPIINKKLKEINASNFNDIWEKIVKESGILRDNNLDEILN